MMFANAFHPCLSFTHAQLGIIAEWGVAQSLELHVVLEAIGESSFQVIEVRRNVGSGLYLINMTERGTVILASSSGHMWEVVTVEAALAKVLQRERLALD